tara:strand:+ start:14969 stop:17095 length:2127 start_codon:yes stop_codon:yes gene_type:complete
MSYIINNTDPFVSIKLTEKGRERLALGQLNFSHWAIGDSEINYNREDDYDETSGIYANVSGSSRILRPKDKQPNFKYYITKDGQTNYNALEGTNISVVKSVVNNSADTRGYFTNSGTSFTTLSSSTYIIDSQIVNNSIFSGGTQVVITGLTYTVGDLMLVKLTNDTVTGQTAFSNSLAIPHLWFKIESSGSTSSELNVDRDLPNLSGSTGTTQIIIYSSGEVWDIYGVNDSPYWDTGTLSFTTCGVSCSDVPVWNQNNIWCEDPAGFSGGTSFNQYEHYWDFGSYDYLGQKHPYFFYPCIGNEETLDIVCEVAGQSTVDTVRKSISVIHYTNNTISNYYGEFLYINNNNGKTVTLEFPDLMWHRRGFSTAQGTQQGMKFLASGATALIPNSDIEYVPLIEDPSLVTTPKVVGKVFPQLKVVILDDDELVMAISYKGNRSWTLPALAANLVAPSLSGVLATNKTMYLTYILENEISGSTTSGLTTSINCQYYTKITNTTPTIKDVDFRINAVDLLPYMRKVENVGYDGLGFYAHKFKVLWQIVDDTDVRPATDAWNVYDYTSTAITGSIDETIDPLALENQNPVVNGFLIDATANTGATQFSIIDTLNFPTDLTPESLQLGDERFFYGNIDTYIGATIFKTLFKVNVSGSDFAYTSNPTRDAGNTTTSIRVSEVGIYDNNKNLVVVGKLSKPVLLTTNNTITLELSIDF